MTSGLDRRDLPWIAAVTVSFLFGLAVSWQQWGSPLVDVGREMNQPLRLAGGEMLYSEVGHIYGPLSPYLHAVLFRQFGASLDILYADGIVTAAIVLALVYWLSRQLMSPAAAAVATAGVTWFCVFRYVGGNYILPYSYGALHGLALGWGTLALLVAALRNEAHPANETSAAGAQSHRSYFLLAGMCAGLATLAKTEMGLSALAAGITAAVLVAYPNLRRGVTLVSYFLAPTMILIVGVYAYFAVRVGWHTLLVESWLLPTSLPPEMVYFNKRISGLDRPGESLWQMFGATIKLGLLATIIAAISGVTTRLSRMWENGRVSMPRMPFAESGDARPAPLWPFLAASLFILSLLPIAVALDWDEGLAGRAASRINALWSPLVRSLDWDQGPYLGMPLVLAGLLIVLLVRFWRATGTPARKHTIVPIVCAVYALTSLLRIMLQVRTDGVYSAYLLPVSVVMFTYCWAQPFAAIFTDGRTRQLARNMALGVILAHVAVTASMMAHRFSDPNITAIRTQRGTIITKPDLGQAWNEALAYIEQHTAPADAIAVLPEGTSLNFLSGRRNPLREDIILPGVLDEAAEARAIRQARDADTRLILIANRPTREFSATVFGRDYNRHLMTWIEENYEPVAMFGPDKAPSLEIGHPTFFIRAYHRKPNP